MRKSIFYNLVGAGFPILAAIICIPLLVEKIGVDKFGSITLAWAVIGYSGVLDLGISRALTLRLSQVASNEDRNLVSEVFWTGVISMLAIATVIATFVVNLNLIFSLSLDERQSLSYIALGTVFVVLSNIMRGVLESFNRFGVINFIRSPLGVYNFAAPLICAHYISDSLDSMVLAVVIGRVIVSIAFAGLAIQTLGKRLNIPSFSKEELKELMTTGGWMTVSNTIGPAIGYMDRFYISSVIGTDKLAFYTVPQDMVSKFTVVPGAVTSVLFPNVASLYANGDIAKIARVVKNSVLSLFSIQLPACIFILIYGGDILTIWIDESFSEKSEFFLQIFTLGFMLNFSMHVPFTAVQSLGKAKIGALIHLIEFTLYIPILAVFCNYFGMFGAAYAWFLRVLVDVLMVGAVYSYLLRRLQINS